MRRRNIESAVENLPKKDENENDKEEVVQGVGVKGCGLPSPSGINTWSTPAQIVVFVAYFGVLAFGTSLYRGILEQYRVPAQDSSKLSIGLGIFYVFVGVSHFLAPKDFENVVPLQGTWGIWYVPGSRSFHVKWTSIVEILGGTGLILGSFGANANLVSVSDCAFVLFFLTVGMTPANLFMMTHGAKLPIVSDPMHVGFHGIRLIVQAWLLAALYRLGEETFEKFL